MKKIVILFVFIFFGFLNSIEAQKQVLKDSLSVTEFLKLNQVVKFDTIEVKFNKMLADSRCPKNVMCNRAGEAFVEVSIFEKGTFIQNKKLRIDASGYVMDSNNLAFKSNDFKVYGFSLKPYPNITVETNDEDYVLEVVFKPKD